MMAKVCFLRISGLILRQGTYGRLARSLPARSSIRSRRSRFASSPLSSAVAVCSIRSAMRNLADCARTLLACASLSAQMRPASSEREQSRRAITSRNSPCSSWSALSAPISSRSAASTSAPRRSSAASFHSSTRASCSCTRSMRRTLAKRCRMPSTLRQPGGEPAVKEA